MVLNENKTGLSGFELTESKLHEVVDRFAGKGLSKGEAFGEPTKKEGIETSKKSCAQVLAYLVYTAHMH